VLDQPPGHAWHVRWLPHKDVSVSPEEADERVFLFGIESHANHGSLAVVTGPEVDGLHLYFLYWLRFVGGVGLHRYLEFGWCELL
jgi:hypothetical protein